MIHKKDCECVNCKAKDSPLREIFLKDVTAEDLSNIEVLDWLEGWGQVMSLSSQKFIRKYGFLLAKLQDDPQWDATDAAHPAWWRGEKYGAWEAARLIADVISGKDTGKGAMNAPVGSMRDAVLELKKERDELLKNDHTTIKGLTRAGIEHLIKTKLALEKERDNLNKRNDIQAKTIYSYQKIKQERDDLKVEREACFMKLNEAQLPICGGSSLDKIVRNLIDKFEEIIKERDNLNRWNDKQIETIKKYQIKRDNLQERNNNQAKTIRSYQTGNETKKLLLQIDKLFTKVGLLEKEYEAAKEMYIRAQKACKKHALRGDALEKENEGCWDRVHDLEEENGRYWEQIEKLEAEILTLKSGSDT